MLEAYIAGSSQQIVQAATPNIHAANKPVIVVGAGPVGIRVAQQILKRMPSRAIVMYGAEPWEPYNRVRISSVLTGELNLAELNNSLQVPKNGHVIQHINCAIVAIDPDNKTVTDAYGIKQVYSQLVLATGSSAFIPPIRGTTLAGVYRYRDLHDIQNLQCKRGESRHTLIIGGGLLGLEAACAMRHGNTEVVVVQSAKRLLPNMLDDEASAMVMNHLNALGIKVMTGDGIDELLGENSLVGARLKSGRLLTCDTAIVATGITPNTSLASETGLVVKHGIVVNDQMQTSDPFIYAAGECAEHRGKVYGWIKPGYEQATVAAEAVLGENTVYTGTIASMRLKLDGLSVFSIGQTRGLNPKLAAAQT